MSSRGSYGDAAGAEVFATVIREGSTLAAAHVADPIFRAITTVDGRPFDIGIIYVHSANPSGAETVVRVLRRWDYRVRRVPA